MSDSSVDEIYVKYGLLKFNKEFVIESLSHVFFDKSTNVVSGLSTIILNGDLNAAKKQISDELNMTLNAQLLPIKKFVDLNGYIDQTVSAATEANAEADAATEAVLDPSVLANMAGE